MSDGGESGNQSRRAESLFADTHSAQSALVACLVNNQPSGDRYLDKQTSTQHVSILVVVKLAATKGIGLLETLHVQTDRIGESPLAKQTVLT